MRKLSDVKAALGEGAGVGGCEPQIDLTFFSRSDRAVE